MKYELLIVTSVCARFSCHDHNREGLDDAFQRIDLARNEAGFVGAKIISERDGLIWDSENSNN